MRVLGQAVLVVVAVGCNCGGGSEVVIGGGTGQDAGRDAGAVDAGRDGGSADAGTPDAGCSGGLGLHCRVATNCPAGSPTKITGVVNIPAGTLPLPNALVYVPNAALAPIPTGASCDLCETAPSGAPLVQTKTDTEGKFELVNVPTGAKVPLVVQVGKWRREIEIANVPACQTTALAPDATRLPRSKAEGHVPKIAVATGGADTLECLLKKVGVALDEFTPASGSGRVNLFAGYGGASAYASTMNGGAAYAGTPALWNSVNVLKGYDLLLLGCEGNTPDPNKSPAAAAEVQKFLQLGGRVFGTHLHQYWVAQSFPSVATFGNHPDLPSPYTADVDTSFPRGAELAQWLVKVGASQTSGKIDINAGQHSIESVNPAVATKWIAGSNPTTVQYFSFKAPLGVPAAQQCGRFVLTDIHVSSGDAQAAFPSGCTTTSLSPQEKVLVYMMFDLSNCVAAEIN